MQRVSKSKASGYIEQLVDVGVYMRDAAETLVNALRHAENHLERRPFVDHSSHAQQRQ